MTTLADTLLQRRLELDEALTAARREVNEAQAKLTLARRRAKVAEKAYQDASAAYFAAVDALPTCPTPFARMRRQQPA